MLVLAIMLFATEPSAGTLLGLKRHANMDCCSAYPLRFNGDRSIHHSNTLAHTCTASCTCAGIVIGIESVLSVIRDHEVCELPGILVGFDLDLLLLLVHGQSACRQHGAGTLAIGGKQQLNSPNTMFPGPRSVV